MVKNTNCDIKIKEKNEKYCCSFQPRNLITQLKIAKDNKRSQANMLEVLILDSDNASH